MAVRKILQYPHPGLKQRSIIVQDIDAEVMNIIRDMWDTTRASPGVALAAPQIGISKRIIVLDVSAKMKKGHHGHIALINPVIKNHEGRQIFREGCLSIPGYTGNVSRYKQVLVEGLNPKGRPVSIAAVGFEALALQHELDHLNGTLFLDRITSLSTDLFRRKG